MLCSAVESPALGTVACCGSIWGTCIYATEFYSWASIFSDLGSPWEQPMIWSDPKLLEYFVLRRWFLDLSVVWVLKARLRYNVAFQKTETSKPLFLGWAWSKGSVLSERTPKPVNSTRLQSQVGLEWPHSWRQDRGQWCQRLREEWELVLKVAEFQLRK